MPVPARRLHAAAEWIRLRCQTAIGAIVPLVVLALAGCASVGPDYVAPQPQVPAAWSEAGDAAPMAPVGADLSHWWRRLDDPALSGLIDAALAGSTDLRSARASLREARARRALAGAELLPTVTGLASGSHSRISPQNGGDSTSSELYSAGFDASWELDVFGGIRRGVEAAQADLEASEADLHATQVSVTAEVALNYVEVRAAQTRLAIARSNLESQSETLQLTDWRAQAGLVSSLDVEQSRANREQTRAQIPSLETSQAQAEHRLAILLGQAPGALREALAAPAPILPLPDRLAVGIPADTLRQRPDVRAAERKLAAQTARVGQAEAARYPSFTLSGSIGLEALTLGALGGNGTLVQSLVVAVGATLFDGGRLRQRVEIQSAVQEQALIGYEAAVLTALEEVENALVALTNSRSREEALRSAADAARNAALLARHRYTSGLIDFQTLLDTERTVLSIEDSVAITQAEGASALVQLYKALGGGWSAAPAP
jgi:NodT family efflux transporter outer membrane factor (OMF) lipoprotein